MIDELVHQVADDLRARDGLRGALKSDGPPRYSRAASGSKLDPFKDEIHRLLKADRGCRRPQRARA